MPIATATTSASRPSASPPIPSRLCTSRWLPARSRSVPRALAASVLLGLAAAAPAPAQALDPAALKRVLQRETNRLGSASGALVVDVDRGKVLFSRRADKQLVPASNEKLFVTAAALRTLGAEATVPTEVRATAAPDATGRVRGDLVVVGGGDPSLGESGLRELAGRIAALGVTEVTGGVVGDESAFDTRRGSYDSAFKPDLDLGGWLGGLVWAHGRAYPGGPARSVAARLQALLKAEGVEFGRAARAGVAPEGAVPLAQHLSPPVRTLAAMTNQPSDNFSAEMLVKLMGAREGAGGTTANGLAVVRRSLGAVGVVPRMVDGSGLSRADRTSVRTVVRLLRAMHDSPLQQPFRLSLAMPGTSGTLRTRMRGTPAVGRCPAKTGTLRGVSALSGYCATADGTTVVFSFIENGVSAPGAKRVEDRMVPAVARYAGG